MAPVSRVHTPHLMGARDLFPKSTAFPSAPIEFPVTCKQGKKRIELAYIEICVHCWNQPEEDGEYIADSLRVSPEKV